MREIKFRTWTGLEMEYRVMAGFLGAFYVQGIDEKDNACLSPMNTKYSEQIPIMQFTGLKDKNGKDIYEGDIVRGEDTQFESEVVNLAIEYISCGFYATKNDYPAFYLTNFTELEVIGNIFENPELLN